MKAVRGAITVDANTVEAIDEATTTLLQEIARRNALGTEEVIGVFFTLTPDLNATFPARAARELGWNVPMLDTQEIDVPGSLTCCLRALILVDRDSPVTPAYLRGARSLRPDLATDDDERVGGGRP